MASSSDIRLRGGQHTEDPRLDEVPTFDERSRAYPIAEIVPKDVVSRGWWVGDPPLDQGREGACVGFAWAHELRASPVRVPGQTNSAARLIYKAAQHIDEWAGEQYEGTSVLAGAKVVRGQKRIKSYRWGFGLNDALRAIVHEGPVVFAIPWYESMYDTRPSSLVEVHGRQVGRHAILGRSVRLAATFKGERGKRQVVGLYNSWGADWGNNGWGYVELDDMARLLSERGQCCVPVGRR